MPWWAISDREGGEEVFSPGGVDCAGCFSLIDRRIMLGFISTNPFRLLSILKLLAHCSSMKIPTSDFFPKPGISLISISIPFVNFALAIELPCGAIQFSL